jgi:hypothetical protein
VASLNFQPRVPVFDANIGVGHRHNRPAPFEDAAGLRKEMQRLGVERALIYQVQGESISPLDGNVELQNWADAEGPFSLQYVAGPGTRSLHQLQDLYAAGKLHSVRLNNADSPRNPFVEWIYGDLLEWMNAEHIPLWVSLADTDTREVITTLKPFPDLVSVLVGAHYTHALFVRALLQNLPNAHLELSRYEVLGEVEALTEEFGHQRLVYGSFYPRYAMGPMLFYLHNIPFSDAELTAICAGNLERILGEGGKND